MFIVLLAIYGAILIPFEIHLAIERRKDRRRALERQQHIVAAGGKVQLELGLLQRMKSDLDKLEQLIAR